MSDASQALFLADHAALDFLNTRYAPDGEVREVIPDGASLLRWLVEARGIDASTASRLKRRWGTEVLDELAVDARKLRDWAALWIERWSDDPAADYATELRRLNGLLAHKRSSSELTQGAEGFGLVERAQLESPPQLIAQLAESLAQLIAAGTPELVKRCAGAGCTLWFLDKTKSHRRLFCSAAACGNRAKVAAFRERQRGS
jgi:predicted RNA-binding Zn ribbon-like protein